MPSGSAQRICSRSTSSTRAARGDEASSTGSESAPAVRLLDVGCGIGGTSRMGAMAGAEVTGIDLSPAFVDTATALTDRWGSASG